MNNQTLAILREANKSLSEQFDSKFDELLRDYIINELSVPEVNIPFLKPDNLVGFEVLYFVEGSKKQFVNTVTKEVLFEVGVRYWSLDDPYSCNHSFEVKYKKGGVWYKVYWR